MIILYFAVNFLVYKRKTPVVTDFRFQCIERATAYNSIDYSQRTGLSYSGESKQNYPFLRFFMLIAFNIL